MKTFFNVLGCLIVLIVAALVGQACGFFNSPGLGEAGGYITWAEHGFKGSPTAQEPTATNKPAPDLARSKAELAQLVSESKRRAIAKYPDLAVANTEMNSRFVFRYNWMSKEGNARLQEANWPETLADDCAAAAKATARAGGATTPRKKLMASSGQ